MLYVHVEYKSTSKTISLIKGLDLEFNGKTAKESIGERQNKYNKV